MKDIKETFKMRLDHTHTFNPESLQKGTNLTKLVLKGPFESKLEIPILDTDKYKDMLFGGYYEIEIIIREEEGNG